MYTRQCKQMNCRRFLRCFLTIRLSNRVPNVTMSNSSDQLHDLVRKGFTNGNFYDNNRPEYLPENVAKLVPLLFNGKTSTTNDDEVDVLELGAGTGKFTRVLCEALSKDITFLSSEPMENFFHSLQHNCPSVTCKMFAAEEIPLPASSVQGVVCAQCFHWFSQTGLDEIHRVLKPGGSLVLIWNTKDLRTKWLNDVINHYKKYKEPSEPWFYDFSWKERLDKMPGFYMSLLQDRLHYPSLQMTRKQFSDHLCSISVFQRMDKEQRQEILSEIYKIMDSYPESSKDHITIPMYNEIYHYVKQ